MIKINFRDLETKEFPNNTSFLEISKSFQHRFEYPILIVMADNDITSLGDIATRNYKVDFFDRSSLTGNHVYRKSLQFLLVVALKKLYGEEVDVLIEHSVSKGVYCELTGITYKEEMLEEIKKEMTKLIGLDIPFDKVSSSRIDSIKYFKNKNWLDKAKVLKYISNSFITLYKLDNVYDYYYSELVPSTNYLSDFMLTDINNKGFILSYPDIFNPETTLPYVHHKLLFDKFLEYTHWGRKLKVSNAADLNEIVSNGKYDELIRLDETYYNAQISEVADDIYVKKDKIKIILLAGPSSSGKTTTSKKLQVYLKSKGINPYQISMDDYFLNRDDMVKDKNGELDFECVEALDVELFNRHLLSLLNGEEVLLPEYNFINGKRFYDSKKLKLEKNDVVIIEGLHALNDLLTMSIDDKNKYKIYISPLTQLNIDNHNYIRISDTRKLRRIVRDNKYRGKNASDTLKMWSKIKKGEEKYIFPYQDEADTIINSAFIYEIGVLKTYAEPLLFSVSEEDEMYPEALRLINFLRNFLPIPSEGVPSDSILREFIGGSSFK
jgi:uridine kinase